MAELLAPNQIQSALADRTGWSGGAEGISRTVAFPSFPAAIAAVSRVAEVAEARDHHPDIDIRWRNVTFHCVTHSAGGVTAQDLALAAQIDEIISAADGQDVAVAEAA